MNAHALVILDALARRWSNFEMGVEAIGGERDFFVANDLAAGDIGAFRAGQIHRNALSPTRAVDSFAMDLQAAHAKQMVAGQATHLVADFDFTAQRCAGHDHAMSLQNKSAVHRQTEVTARRRLIQLL